ncbi:MAG: CdaR family protein [Desulfovibrionaceae bacterium]
MSFNYTSRTHWLLLILAFLSALAMWYSVTISDRLDAQVDIRLDYKGIPENLIVMDGLLSKVTVRIRGPQTLVRSINPQDISQIINLARIKKGTNVIPLVPEKLDSNIRAFEVVEVVPPRLTLEVDALVERVLPVKPVLKSLLTGSALTVGGMTVIPSNVSVRGPESMVGAMRNVNLNIPLDPNAIAGIHSQMFALDLPSLVTATPGAVKVEYTITSGRKEVVLQREVIVDAPDRRNYTVSPSSLTMHVEIPEALYKNTNYLNKARLSVTPPTMQGGAKELVPIHVELPDGMRAVEPVQATVTVTKRK